MGCNHKSSSHVQRQAETILFEKVQDHLSVKLERNRRIPVVNDGYTYIEPDFYSAEHLIVGEIFAHIGKPKKAQDNKIANDILKMLLLDQVTGKQHLKFIVVCDIIEKEHLEGKSALAESIRQFGIKILPLDLDEDMRQQILHAQELQQMTNTE